MDTDNLANKPSQTVMIRLGLIDENTWNPNRMTDDEFGQLVLELNRLGDVPKPIVVRRKGDKYEVIDGAHTLLAAEELGWEEVRCQVVDVDDFEAMRQTWKRNQHGSHNPLLEGEMFARMMKERKLSGRQLAAEMGIAEGTVRNSLSYAKALRLRNSCAPDKKQVRAEIESLTIRQVSKYVSLPKSIRDKWLHAGADMSDADRLTDEVLEAIDRWHVADVLPCDDAGVFTIMLMHIRGLAKWAQSHADIPDLDEYLRPIIMRGLPHSCIEELPYAYQDGEARVMISPVEWEDALRTCIDRAGNTYHAADYLDDEIRRRLRAANIDPESLTPVNVDAVWQEIQADEDYQFLAEADQLTIDERVGMYMMKLRASAATRIKAMQYTCDYFATTRGGEQMLEQVPNLGDSPFVVLKKAAGFHRLTKRLRADKEKRRNPDKLVADLLEVFDSDVLRAAKINGRPAAEVLEERLRAIGPPELSMMTQMEKPYPVDVISEWLDVIGAEVPEDAVIDDIEQV